MNAHKWSSAVYKLPLKLPSPPEGACYQLVWISGVRPDYENRLAFEILLHFQLKLSLDSTSTNFGRTIPYCVHQHYLPLLVLGTLWSETGQLIIPPTALFTIRQQIQIGKGPTKVRLLNRAVPSAIYYKLGLVPRQGQLPCLYIPQKDGILLIPCIEVLRAFYYRAGSKLIDYFFSRLPIHLFCASTVNSLQFTLSPEMFIATQRLAPEGIRLFTELLFNDSFHNTIRTTHAQQALYWQSLENKHINKILSPFAPFYTNLNLGHSISLEVLGKSAEHDGKRYILGNFISPLSSYYSMQRIRVSLLASRQHNNTQVDASPLPFYPDLFARLYLTGKNPSASELPISKIPLPVKELLYTQYQDDIYPRISSKKAWARVASPKQLLNDSISSIIKALDR